jgi:hypothetical protein
METQVWNSYVLSNLNYQISSTPFLLNNIFILTNITFLYRVVSTYIFLKYSYLQTYMVSIKFPFKTSVIVDYIIKSRSESFCAKPRD